MGNRNSRERVYFDEEFDVVEQKGYIPPKSREKYTFEGTMIDDGGNTPDTRGRTLVAIEVEQRDVGQKKHSCIEKLLNKNKKNKGPEMNL